MNHAPDAPPTSRGAPASLLPRIVLGVRRVGVSLDEGHIAAVTVRSSLGKLAPSLVLDRSLAPPEGGDWPDLMQAFADLRESLPDEDLALDVALHRPICDLKKVILPALRRSSLQKLLQMNTRRFFTTDAEVFSDAIRVSGSRSDRGRAWIAAASGERVATVISLAEGAGLRVNSVTPAAFALARGAIVLDRALRRSNTTLVLVSDSRVELAVLERGRLQIIRSAPLHDCHDGSDPREPFVAQVGSSIEKLLHESFRSESETAQKLTLVPVGASGEWLEQAMTSTSLPLSVDVRQSEPLGNVTPSALCALGAIWTKEDAIQLVPPPLRDRLRRRGRRRAVALAASAGILVSVAGALYLAQVQQELDEVRDARMTIQPAVEQAMRVRSELYGLERRVAFLSDSASGGTGWTSTIASLTAALPDHAYLIGLESDGEVLRLTGRSRSAAEVLPELERSGWFPASTLMPTVRRIAGETGPNEAFEIQVTRAYTGSDEVSGSEHLVLVPDTAGESVAAGEADGMVESSQSRSKLDLGEASGRKQ